MNKWFWQKLSIASVTMMFFSSFLLAEDGFKPFVKSAKAEIATPSYMTGVYSGLWALVMIALCLLWRKQRKLDKDVKALSDKLRD